MINTGMLLNCDFEAENAEIYSFLIRKLKKGEKREETEPVTVTLNFFKNVHSKDKNQILQ